MNGAQVIIDQFLVSGLSKWQQTSRLTLLLPHGYEGNGPEHSSARLERFLQLAAQENIRIVNATTAAQYFHLLRRQALDPSARPLIVMTPEGAAAAEGGDVEPARARRGLRSSRCSTSRASTASARSGSSSASGKLYYDIVGHPERAERDPRSRSRGSSSSTRSPWRPPRSSCARYPALEEVVWAQEEPQNMGAYRAIRHRLEDATGGRVPLRYAGRPWRASPSEGYPTAHLREQDRIVRTVLERFLRRRGFRRLRLATARATAGPCLRASAVMRRRCFGGILRQMS